MRTVSVLIIGQVSGLGLLKKNVVATDQSAQENAKLATEMRTLAKSSITSGLKTYAASWLNSIHRMPLSMNSTQGMTVQSDLSSGEDIMGFLLAAYICFVYSSFVGRQHVWGYNWMAYQRPLAYGPNEGMGMIKKNRNIK